MKSILAAVILVVLLASGCTPGEDIQPKTTDRDRAVMACRDACDNEAAAGGKDLSVGPCLLNPVESAPDWVCDVAHNPRQSVDDHPENQCSAFREGKAHHFVELDEKCNFIRAV